MVPYERGDAASAGAPRRGAERRVTDGSSGSTALNDTLRMPLRRVRVHSHVLEYGRWPMLSPEA
eukprot:484332-Prymnesium_polylepis.2